MSSYTYGKMLFVIAYLWEDAHCRRIYSIWEDAHLNEHSVNFIAIVYLWEDVHCHCIFVGRCS